MEIKPSVWVVLLCVVIVVFILVNVSFFLRTTNSGLEYKTLPIIQEAKNVSLHQESDFKKAYVINEGSEDIAVINLETLDVVKLIVVGGHPRGGTVYDNMLYVTHGKNSLISLVDVLQDEKVGSFTIKNIAGGIAISKNKLYVTDELDSLIAVYDLDNKGLVKEIPVGEDPFIIVPDPKVNVVYVTNTKSDEISMINTKNDVLIDSLETGDSPHGVAVHPSGGPLFVANKFSNDVSVLRLKGDSGERIVLGGAPFHVAVADDGVLVAVSQETADTVTFFSADTSNVVKTIRVGRNPGSLVFDEEHLYVLNKGAGTMSVIDVVSYEVIATVDVGHTPRSIFILER